METYFHLVPLYSWGQMGRCFHCHLGNERKLGPRQPVAELDVVPRATLELVPSVLWGGAGVLEGRVRPDSQARVVRTENGRGGA